MASRPENSNHFIGLCPRAEVYSIRLGYEVKKISHIAVSRAFEILLRHKVHLINCSFSFDSQYHNVDHWISEAWANGTLVIAAAGNTGGRVKYPAANTETVSVSAFGDRSCFSDNTDSELTMPAFENSSLWDGDLFIPNFAARVGKIDCVAPGVGVTTLSPPKGRLPFCYMQFSGTSFSTPIVTGLLATALSKDNDYKNLPADSLRAAYAKRILKEMCQQFRFPTEIQGEGAPTF